MKAENKINRGIKLLWNVVVNSNNTNIFQTLKNYLNTVMWNQYYFKEYNLKTEKTKKTKCI